MAYSEFEEITAPPPTASTYAWPKLRQVGLEADFLARNQSIAFDGNDGQNTPFIDTKLSPLTGLEPL
jgi:hypothetical protein